MLESVDFKGKPLSIHTNELMTELSKKMPKLTFDYETEGYRTGREHSSGIYRKLNVYDGRMMIGEIGDSGSNDSIKYYVASPNVKTGRYHYQISMSDAKMKQSIHLKEVIKVAVTALTPLTFSQAMESSYNSFRRNMQNFTWEKERQIKQNTFDSYELLEKDAVELFKQGVKFNSPMLDSAVKYIAENQEFIKKYWHYNPECCGVWITDRGVQYKKNKEPEVLVATKADLPEYLMNKVCILDIMDKKNFVEDMGYKDDDQSYWIVV